MTDDEILKQCPFCGGIPILKVYKAETRPFIYFTDRYAVQCEYTGDVQGCGAEGQHNKIKEIAIDMWNTRVD